MPPASRRAALVSLGVCAAGCAAACGDREPPARDPGSPVGPLAADAPNAPGLRFTDQAAAAGLDVVSWCGSTPERKRTILESLGQGAAWLDDDRDGLLDLYVVNGSSLEELPDPPPTDRFFRNRGDGTFADVTAAAGLADAGWGHGVAAADYDNDGDTDLFVSHWGAHRLHRASATDDPAAPTRYTDVAAAAGVACEADPPSWGSGCAWGDVDADGFLDLYVGHYLSFDPDDPPGGGGTGNWKGVRDVFFGPLGCVAQRDRLFRNRGDGTFEDATERSGVAAAAPSFTLGVLFGDLDLDGDADLYVANDSKANYLFVNDGAGRFEERGALAGLAYGDQGNAQAGMGVDAADWDGDGRDDLVVTNFDDDFNTLYLARGRTFVDVTVRSRLAVFSRNVLSWGCGLVDFDHDGDRDLFVACGHIYPAVDRDKLDTSYRQVNQLLVAEGERFVDAGARSGPAFAVLETSRGAAFGDYDRDGDVDVFVTNLNRPPTLYRNDTLGAGASIQVALAGSRSNRDGVGARVTVRAAGRLWSAERRAGASFLSTSSPWLHFGLGAARRIDAIEVRWPSGTTSTHGPFDLDELGRGARVLLAEPTD